VILDAIGALVMSDLLTADDLEALTAPWQEFVSGR
jgi:hypothetical protein